MGFFLVLVCLLVAAVGSIWLLVLAFRENVWWGLGSLFLPFVIVIFAIMHWPVAKRAFLIYVASIPLFIIGFVMAASSVASEAIASPPPF